MFKKNHSAMLNISVITCRNHHVLLSKYDLGVQHLEKFFCTCIIYGLKKYTFQKHLVIHLYNNLISLTSLQNLESIYLSSLLLKEYSI